MGTVCCHSENQSNDVVELLQSPSFTEIARVPRRSLSNLIRQHEGDDEFAMPACESDEEQTDKCSTLTAFATITFDQCDAAPDPNVVATLMKQRTREMSEAHECPSLKKLLSRASTTLSGKPDFTGVWKCIDTWNLDGFLQACGVNKLQRLAACKAPWPWWSMEHEFDIIYFINHGPLGDIEEFIDLSGKEYISYDGKKQKMTNKASWDGATLVIVRDGPLGVFREERTFVDKDTLSFKLTIVSGPKPGGSWGRTFKRGGEDLSRKSENRRQSWKESRTSMGCSC